jgi:membrane associated rhomboid family serine protease
LIPLKDNIPSDRLPVATLALIAAGVLASVVLDDAGWELAHLVSAAVVLWIAGPSVEHALGRAAFLAFAVAGGAAAIGLVAVADASDALGPAGASGAVSAVLGAHLLLFRGAAVVTVVLLPFFFTLVEVPAVALALLWLGVQVLFGTLLATAGGFVLGVALARLLARPKRHIPAAYRV